MPVRHWTSLKFMHAVTHCLRIASRFVSAGALAVDVWVEAMPADEASASGSESDAMYLFHRSTAREMESPSAWRAISHLMVSMSYCEYKR
jgi:hypothetical protein